MSDTSASLAQFGKHFQEHLFYAFLTDRKWAQQIIDVFNPTYFELKYLQFLSDRYFTYAKKYKDFPTLPLLVTIIKSDLKEANDVLLRDQIIDYLQRIKLNADLGDLPYVKEKSLDFCRKQALKTALDSVVDLMETEKYESIVDVVRKAVTIGTVSSTGHDLFNDIEARFVATKRECIPTGIPQLDAPLILNGGMGGGELITTIGSTGAGKTHFLVDRGACALKLKKNVLHYTFELSELTVGTRYDSNLCGIDANDVFTHKDEVLKFYSENKNNLGRLIIKEYPTSSVTVHTLRAHIERLSLEGFKPDIVIVDYADIMRSSRQFDSLRHELKLIYEELRALAHDLCVPVLTASQSNKEGTHSDVIDETNMSEGFSKAFVADIILTISRKPLEKSTGKGRLFVAKNRAGKDGLLFPLSINTARSIFTVTGDNITPDSAQKTDESETKAALRKKWQQLQEDRTMKFTDVRSAVSEDKKTVVEPESTER